MSEKELLKIIKNRRSPVVFSSKLIESEKIELLFEAARWAPSSMNEQPWRFIYASQEDETAFSRLYHCLAEGNKPWNKKIPLLVVGIAKLNFDYKNRPNKHAKYDLASAVANLTYQANSMDLWVHQMGGFDPEKAKNDLNIPEGFEPVVMLAIGYLGDVQNADEQLKKREIAERIRKPLSQFVFKNVWS